MIPQTIKNRVWRHITVVPYILDAEAEVLVGPEGAEAAWGTGTVRTLSLREGV